MKDRLKYKLIVPSLMIFFGFLLLFIVVISISYSISLVHLISYFCCGGLFGVGISLLSFKAENLRRLDSERIMKEFMKLIFIFIIIISPVYVIPLYFIYFVSNGFLLLLTYIAGGSLIGGVTTLILNFQKRDMSEPADELKNISKFFIIIATSFALIVAGCSIIYAFYSTYAVLGVILIFFGLMSLIYARKVKVGIDI